MCGLITAYDISDDVLANNGLISRAYHWVRGLFAYRIYLFNDCVLRIQEFRNIDNICVCSYSQRPTSFDNSNLILSAFRRELLHSPVEYVKTTMRVEEENWSNVCYEWAQQHLHYVYDDIPF